MFVKPPGPRHTLQEIPGGIEFHLPAKRNLIFLIGLGVWLLFWAFGGVSAAISSVKPASKEEPFIFIFLIVWAGVGLFPLYCWLWMVKGREIIQVTASSVSIKRDLFGHGRRREYDHAHVRDLRVAPVTFNPWDFSAGLAFWGVGGGLIAFDYGYKTFRFGAGLDEAEARYIRERILEGFPALGKKETATVSNF